MKEAVLHFLEEYPHLALVSGFTIAFLVTLIGIIPSFFVTTANVLFFGVAEGLAITFAGENCGSALAFFLYRKGLKKNLGPQLEKYQTMKALLEADNKKAFWLIFSMRLIPLLPSGLVTFTAAMGRASFITFVAANALGKFPSLLLEALAVHEVREFGWQGKLILAAIAAAALYFVIKKIVQSGER
ncbi:MAG: VTT domain-containing protein [Bacteroidota bacterium]|nr:VTT domain-containing protein [Bacteroidota bacterium]